MKTKKRKTTIPYIILFIVAVCVVIWSIKGMLQNVPTEMAKNAEFKDVVTVKGYMVKEEVALEGISGEYVYYPVQNGERVAQGVVVAQEFSSAEKVDARIEANEKAALAERYSRLTQMDAGSEKEQTELRLNSKLDEYIAVAQSGNLSKMSQATEDMVVALSEKKIVSGGADNINEKISRLEAESVSLLQKSGDPDREVKATAAGYYVNTVDGLEQQIDYSAVNSIGCDDIEAALKSKTEKSYDNCKIITGLEWYLVCNLPSKDADKLKVNSTITITMPQISSTEMPAVVTALNYNKANSSCAVVLRCNYMSSALSSARIEDVSIQLASYSGLRVPRSALHIVDGVSGVYVLNGNIAEFKPVEIVYSGKDFVICAIDNANTNSLSLNEEVILSNNVSDGKAVK